MKEYKIKINGNDYNVTIDAVEGTKAAVEVNGTPYTVEFEQPISKPKNITVVKAAAPSPSAPSTAKPNVTAPTVATGDEIITSPLPGVILELKVNQGASVKKGQTVMVLEAMKMENAIEAPVDGIVKEINAHKGDSVLEGAQLMIIG
ncbi:MAG: biotin/lipoyl-binding protein [Bacteroidales bacterium]|nr:biotin/lipoyl-binding protein [Bacteroidales bacterium]MDD3200732.1 biotin/lipoyl-binding protein [Bacteroidales bacterium]